MIDTTNFIKKRPLIVFVSVVLSVVTLMCIVHYERYSVSSEQAKLTSEIKSVASTQIKSVLVEQYDQVPTSFRKEITNPNKVNKVLAYLKLADTKPIVGSHVYPLYKCTMTFNSTSGRVLRVLVEVLSDKPEDAYLSDDFYVRQNDGTFVQYNMKPVYVAGLGSWLIGEVPEGKM